MSLNYQKGRGNLIVEYPGSVPGKILSFVGMHMDVVTAIPDDWEFDPFSLSIDGDKLRGRGTTDCLGHVALVTELMKRLGQTKPALRSTVVAVFIASEENSSIPGVGVDMLLKDKLLDKLRSGPLYWIDWADKQPCIGTGGMIPWKLHVTGKLFHSGLPDKAINALELGMDGLKEIQTRFYRDFPPHPQEKVYSIHHEANTMELSRRRNQPNPWRLYHFWRCQVNSILRLERSDDETARVCRRHKHKHNGARNPWSCFEIRLTG